MANKPRKPSNLGAKGARFWDDIAGTYIMRPDELRTLEDTCREIDLIERLEVELRTADLMVKGSMGQMVSSPLVSELRQHRATLNTLMKSLKLPDEVAGDSAGDASSAARKAATARWQRGA